MSRQVPEYSFTARYAPEAESPTTHELPEAIREITDIFASLGFHRARYPEVEWDWYAFEGLNMAENHPARDEWETFFVESLENKKYGRGVLTPHTSSGQLREMEKYSSVSILLDAWSAERAGGSGKAFCWEWAGEARKKRDFILSGGLNPMNVYQAVQRLKPVGVDVCSGVEQIPGKKDLWKMIDFVKEVKRADDSTR